MADRNPAQQDLIDRLNVPRSERPSFDAELRHQVRGFIEHGTAEAIAALGPKQTLDVYKGALNNVHGCEGRYLHDDFEWTVPRARGTVAHRAIQLSVHVREEPTPLDLVDDAMARLENETSDFAQWLQGLSEYDRADLRGEAGERVTQFVECWPRLEAKWKPSTEMRMRQDLHDGALVLKGKVDLTLGAANGLVAGKVIVDLKSGTPRPSHFDDLRFYALIETMRIGVPPMRLGSYYLDQATLHAENVTEAVLESAAARVVDGVNKMVELRLATRAPRLAPSALCRWCPVVDTCDDGTAWLRGRDDPSPVEDDSDDY